MFFARKASRRHSSKNLVGFWEQNWVGRSQAHVRGLTRLPEGAWKLPRNILGALCTWAIPFVLREHAHPHPWLQSSRAVLLPVDFPQRKSQNVRELDRAGCDNAIRLRRPTESLETTVPEREGVLHVDHSDPAEVDGEQAAQRHRNASHQDAEGLLILRSPEVTPGNSVQDSKCALIV